MPGAMGGEPLLEGAMLEGAVGQMALESLVEEETTGVAPGGLGQPAAPDEPGQHGEGKKSKPPWPSNRALTITIVLATLVAAVSGFLLNRASAASSNASDLAQQLSLRGSADSTSAYQQAETDYAQYLDLQAEQAKAAQEMVEAGYNQPGALNWRHLYKVAIAQADRTASEVPGDLHPDLADGNPDVSFPFDFFDRRAFEGTYLESKSDAYNDVSGEWNRIVDSYTAILTMLAVSLFLFGSAYVLYGRNRVLFSAIGGGLVAVGLVWGGALVTLNVPNKVSDAAARNYANGVVALSEANGQAGYRVAMADFTASIKERPDYAAAYARRAQAEDGIGSEELGSGLVSNVSPYWARLAAADDLQAYQLGDQTVQEVSNVGWDSYSLWLMDGTKGAPPAASLRFNSLAVQLDPVDPVNWMNLAIDQLATGDYDDALSSYRAAATHILYTCAKGADLSTCTKLQPSEALGFQEQWLAGGMQDLEGLASSPEGLAEPALRAAVAKAKGILTGSLAAGAVVGGPRPLPFKTPLMTGFIDPNIIQLDVALPNGMTRTQMGRLPLTVIWYQRAESSDNWNGIAETTCWGNTNQLVQTDCAVWKQQGGYYQFRTRFLYADSQCFTDVQYKAELYANGALVGSVTLPNKRSNGDYISTDLAAALAPSMNVGICVPSTWTRQPAQTMTVDVSGSNQKINGPLYGAEAYYASPDKKSGVYLLRFYTLHQNYSTNKQLQQVVTQVEEYAMDLFKGHGLPSDLVSTSSYSPVSLWGDQLADMMTNVYGAGGDYAAVGGALVSSGAASYGAQIQDQTIAESTSYDDAVVVAIVYGPSSTLWSGNHALGIQVLTSCSLLNDG